jgi:hypothetical protein
MGLDLEPDDDYSQRRMQQLENRHRRAQFILTGAQTRYQALADTYGVSDAELRQAGYRVKRARQQLEDILSTIEFLEDQNFSEVAIRRVG